MRGRGEKVGRGISIKHTNSNLDIKEIIDMVVQILEKLILTGGREVKKRLKSIKYIWSIMT